MYISQLEERRIIPQELLIHVIVEAVKPLFEPTFPSVYAQWKKELVQDNDVDLPSIQALKSYFVDFLFPNQHLSKHMIYNAVELYEDSIRSDLEPYMKTDQQSLDGKVLTQEYIYSSMNPEFQLMRRLVTKKDQFVEGEEGIYESELIDSKGNVLGLAEVRPNEIKPDATEEERLWLSLVEKTLNNLDEWTADLFDMICYFWAGQEKDSNGYIQFHSDDALRLKYANAMMDKDFVVRERERFNIMRRVAALSNIWVSIGNNSVTIINKQQLPDAQTYDFTKFTRMFDIGTLDMAYDKKTHKAKGIYSLQIKPSPILSHYLSSGQYTFGALDLKVFQYSHYRQREHKRMTRYLNFQWKIRTLKRTLTRPFRVQTLIDAIDFPDSYNGTILRDRFEALLDDLQKDQVIKEWSYKEPVDESKVGKRGWIKNYWGQLLIKIEPPDAIIIENSKKLTQVPKLTRQIHTQQIVMELDVQEVSEITPIVDEQTEILLKVKQVKEEKKLSLRQVANLIGINAMTLSRYFKNKGSKFNAKNLQKMKLWVESLNKDQ
ncbi:hypothetical protein [Viridibacillus arvi]|uniref:hypothetical protein n=1 Tax=Viridibacillus arvi TaxID=263475 RepID=UPI0034CDFD38